MLCTVCGVSESGDEVLSEQAVSTPDIISRVTNKADDFFIFTTLSLFYGYEVVGTRNFTIFSEFCPDVRMWLSGGRMCFCLKSF